MGCTSCTGQSSRRYNTRFPGLPLYAPSPQGDHYPGIFSRDIFYNEATESRYRHRRPESTRFSESALPSSYRSFRRRFEEKEARSREQYPLTMDAIERTVSKTARLYARRTGARPRFPDAVYLTDDLPPGVGGLEEEFDLGGRTFRAIAISDRYTCSPVARDVAKKITRHETVHVNQPGKHALSRIKYNGIGIGRQLLEGYTQQTIDSLGEEKPFAYLNEERLARAVNRAAPIHKLLLAAEYGGEDAAVRFLNQPVVRAAIDRHYTPYQQASKPSRN